MKPQNLIPQIGFVHMCVDFCGLNAFMAKHLLNDAQVGPAFQQMRGEGVPERMWADGFGDAGQPSQILNDAKHHGTA